MEAAAARGPGIELLEYLAPEGSRTLAEPLRANDVAYWQTRLALARASDGEDPLAHPLAVELPASALGFDAAWTIGDADGHAIQFATVR